MGKVGLPAYSNKKLDKDCRDENIIFQLVGKAINVCYCFFLTTTLFHDKTAVCGALRERN